MLKLVNLEEGGDCVLKPESFLDLIAVLRVENQRHRLFCQLLKNLVDDLTHLRIEETAWTLRDYIDNELFSDFRDEEELWGPRLRKQAKGDEAVEFAVLEAGRYRLKAAPLIDGTCGGLNEIAAGRLPQNMRQFVIFAFQLAEVLGDHIDWTERVILPIAAERLSSNERQALGIEIGERRGVPLPTVH